MVSNDMNIELIEIDYDHVTIRGRYGNINS